MSPLTTPLVPVSRTRRGTARRLGLRAASVAAAALLLAGCAGEPAADSSSTTPPAASPTSTPPDVVVDGSPQDAGEATGSATAAVTSFYETMAAVQAAGGADLAPLSTVATGAALDTVISDTTWLADGGYTVTGAMTFSPTDSAVSSLVAADGETYPFGSVLVSGCQDNSDYTIAQGGEAITLPVAPRTLFDYTVVFEPTAEVWLVESIGGEDATC